MPQFQIEYGDDAPTDYEPESPVREPPPVPHPDESEAKRPRGLRHGPKYDLKWVEQLERDAAQEAQELDAFAALQETEEAFQISFDLSVESHRQRKQRRQRGCFS